MEVPQCTQRRQLRERRTKPLHATAFLIHRHQQLRLACRMDVVDQGGKLLRAFEIAREQDDAAKRRMLQPFTFILIQRGTTQIDHQRTK
jgi:hypothetical protein